MSRVSDVLREFQFSDEEIARRSRLGIERVRKILAGEEPTLGDLRAISRGLRIPLGRFADSSGTPSQLKLKFRTTTKNRPDLGAEAAQSFVSAALEILPRRDRTPDWISLLGFRGESAEEAVRLATEFRREYFSNLQEEPLTDLPDLLNALGGVVTARLETSRFEGASIISGGYCFIFVSPRIPSRMLFTLAHELGHLLASPSEHDQVVFDLTSQIGGYRPLNQTERFADAFASELLLPTRGLVVALQQIRESLYANSEAIGDIEILYLARIFGVSFAAAAMKCESLGLLPKGGAYSLNEHLKKSYGSPEKRADAVGIASRASFGLPPVSPNLLTAAIEKIEGGEVSLGWVTDKFNCTANDIYASRMNSRVTLGTRG